MQQSSNILGQKLSVPSSDVTGAADRSVDASQSVPENPPHYCQPSSHPNLMNNCVSGASQQSTVGEHRGIDNGDNCDKNSLPPYVKGCVVVPDSAESLKGGNKKTDSNSINEEQSEWYACGIDGCSYTVRRLGNLRQHQMHIHGINVVWRYCPHCNYRSKNNSNLKQHLSNIHNIGVSWYKCK